MKPDWIKIGLRRRAAGWRRPGRPWTRGGRQKHGSGCADFASVQKKAQTTFFLHQYSAKKTGYKCIPKTVVFLGAPPVPLDFCAALALLGLGMARRVITPGFNLLNRWVIHTVAGSFLNYPYPPPCLILLIQYVATRDCWQGPDGSSKTSAVSPAFDRLLSLGPCHESRPQSVPQRPLGHRIGVLTYQNQLQGYLYILVDHRNIR